MNVSQNAVVVARTVLVPCPRCGHNNCPARRPVEALKLFLTDKLPPCKKCGRALKMSEFKPLPETSVYMKKARRELAEQSNR